MTDAVRSPFELVPRMARRIARLDPGPAAALRRGPASGAGTAAYWRLVAPLENDQTWGENDGWETIIQSMAILTPRGEASDKSPCHDPTKAMGAVLFESGFTELRLAHMISAPSTTRRRLLVRACRRLAASGHARFDMKTLARFVLVLHDDEPAKQIAREYYRAEAKARRSNTRPEEESMK